MLTFRARFTAFSLHEFDVSLKNDDLFKAVNLSAAHRLFAQIFHARTLGFFVDTA